MILSCRDYQTEKMVSVKNNSTGFRFTVTILQVFIASGPLLFPLIPMHIRVNVYRFIGKRGDLGNAYSI